MLSSSHEINAAIRAIQGESDVDVVRHALDEATLARIIACAPHTHPVIRAVAALSGKLPALPNELDIADPALPDAVARLVGTDAGDRILPSLVKVASAGWGSNLAATLIDAVQNRRCNPGTAAALLGPCDMSAALLRKPNDIAFAIQRWGQSSPDTPTAWMNSLSVHHRDWLIEAVQSEPSAVARCFPWLPSNIEHWMAFDDVSLDRALSACAEASSSARAAHAVLLQRLIAHASPRHLEALTRLACAMTSEDVWARVRTLIQTSPDDARHVVAAAPWDDLDETVRAVILGRADQSDICTAVAAAQGHTDVGRMRLEYADSFFAALDPRVWFSLSENVQRDLVHALSHFESHLAVRSIGLCPVILSRAHLDDNLIVSARRHTSKADDLHWAILPVALRHHPFDDVQALMTSLPTSPPDPSAFFVITSAYGDNSRAASEYASSLTLDDLAFAVIVVRRCRNFPYRTLHEQCEALHGALCGRTWEHLERIMPMFDAQFRAMLMPDRDELMQYLASSKRRSVLRKALNRLLSLPPEVAVPALYALRHWGIERGCMIKTTEEVVRILRGHGDVFLSLVDAIDDKLRAILFPHPKNGTAMHALRDLAREDPLSAHRLGEALRTLEWNELHGHFRSEDWTPARCETIHALLTISPSHAVAVWESLDETLRLGIVTVITATSPVAASLMEHDPIFGLALAAVQSNDDYLRDAGRSTLTERMGDLRKNWDQLPPDVRQALGAHPLIALSVADLLQTYPPVAPRIRRR